MPATQRRFSETPPQRLYLDTDFILSALIRTQPYHHACKAFVLRLQQMGLTRLYVSPLTWGEFMDVVTRDRFRTQLDASIQMRFRLDRWHEPLVRDTYLQWMRGLLETLLKQFQSAEIGITSAVRVQALQYMGQYALRSQDAFHLAVMTQARVFDLASLDESFRRVDGLTLWNDGIHAAAEQR